MARDISDNTDNAETQQESAPTAQRLSPAGRRSIQGQSAPGERDSMKGPDFEAWARQDVFHDHGRRLTVHPEDNPQLDLQSDSGLGLTKRRQSDAYLGEDGFIYELKAGYDKGGIDKDQAYEYAVMQDAGHVFERDANGRKQNNPTEIKGVSYIFDKKAGAEANRSELEQYGFGIFFRDEEGRLQQLRQ